MNYMYKPKKGQIPLFQHGHRFDTWYMALMYNRVISDFRESTMVVAKHLIVFKLVFKKSSIESRPIFYIIDHCTRAIKSGTVGAIS